MAIKDNKDWISLKSNKELYKKKLEYFEKTTKVKIQVAYEKGSFCSGFASKMVVFGTDSGIFAIDDNFIIYQNINNKWGKWNENNL